MKGPGWGNAEIGGVGGAPGLTKTAVTKIVKLDPRFVIELKDYMGSDWIRKFGFSSSLSLTMPAGGAGGGGGGAGADLMIHYVESGSEGTQSQASYRSLVTGSRYGSDPLVASGGAGGFGSAVDYQRYPGAYYGPPLLGPGSGSVGGSGGGGGGSGGVLFISARNIKLSATSYLIASGGNGGRGSPGWNGMYNAGTGNPNQGPLDDPLNSNVGSGGGGGGGGGAGAGGIILILSETSQSVAGFVPSNTTRFNVKGGTGGAGGNGWTNYWSSWGYTVYSSAGVPGASADPGSTFYIKIASNDSIYPILDLDAADSLSYPGTGTVWYDLTANVYNATLVNGPTFDSSNGGSIVFDGSNDYASIASLPNNLSIFTLDIWFYPYNVVNYQNIIDCNYNYNGRGNIGPRIEMTTAGALYGVISGNPTFQNPFDTFTAKSSGLTANKWYNMTVTRASGYILTYLNGSLVESRDNPNGFINQMTSILLGTGYYNFAERRFSGRIAKVAIYDKSLQRKDITNKYNSLKVRFGL